MTAPGRPKRGRRLPPDPGVGVIAGAMGKVVEGSAHDRAPTALDAREGVDRVSPDPRHRVVSKRLAEGLQTTRVIQMVKNVEVERHLPRVPHRIHLPRRNGAVPADELLDTSVELLGHSVEANCPAARAE